MNRICESDQQWSERMARSAQDLLEGQLAQHATDAALSGYPMDDLVQRYRLAAAKVRALFGVADVR